MTLSTIAVIYQQPIASFALLLAVILLVPLVFERFKIPGLLGLLASGVVLGSNGLNLLSTDSETMSLLSDIGLVYLMFVAGLEVDLQQFQQTKNKSIGFGSLTFVVPLIVGTIVGRLFGFGWNSAILIGSLFASHTLLAYPLISRLGVVKNEAVTVTIGATIFTDISALLVLAVCVGIHKGDFTAFSLITLLVSLAIYAALILFGFSWLGREFFKRSGEEEGNQFLFILLVVFVSALGAELIGVEKIVGAFLAGLAVNRAIGDGPVKEKVVFVGNVLFIPIFFIDLGLLINIRGFISSLGSIWLTLAILIGLIGSKFIAALLAKLLYRYNWREMITMWSLSLPQVAATLAATLVGFRVGLLSEGVLNGVIVLMLVTATLGPLITARSAIGLTVPEDAQPDLGISLFNPGEAAARLPLIVVPIHNPNTQQHLIEMAALLLSDRADGKVMPLAVTMAPLHLDAPELGNMLQRSQMFLTQATELSRSLGVEAEPHLRIDDNIANGISRVSRERNASLIILGWGKATRFRARLFGSLIDNVLWAAHCPVAVTRLLEAPSNIRRVLVPIENLTPDTLRSIRFAAPFAQSNGAAVTLLHVCDRRMSPSRIAWLHSQLNLLVSKYALSFQPEIRVINSDDIAGTILQAAKACDLLILRSQRRRLALGELNISDVTTQVVRQVACSIVMLGEPQSLPAMSLLRTGAASESIDRPRILKH